MKSLNNIMPNPDHHKKQMKCMGMECRDCAFPDYLRKQLIIENRKRVNYDVDIVTDINNSIIKIGLNKTPNIYNKSLNGICYALKMAITKKIINEILK